ncbi:phosphoribosylanthranilate isomerase [Candidatus Azobacteroides pseudotrichonymphae]|uniref:N-(5'-phosphoribosyl)anthranilate isomerase n=1 Tax=Azobacteroides pseudotrichonymphae genomovar. CFP2 TaxID=511995 RepID=B6YR33_AZOPC|nr:phosphoribosylanthranilate isomerase [Candidatus Azobacteroides pseudotrichonymphae]BAG83655.1 phosphoribosylanthranilate isomerase [Candidatus Azobacteroides pseudotrichonymphae genomovar. CFP2]
MKIKVCGMKYPENIAALSRLPIQMIGLIFYKKSTRYVKEVDIKIVELPKHIQLVAVFVDEVLKNILDTINQYGINIVQLHGVESPQLCKELKKQGITVIKAFSIEEEEDLMSCIFYENVCDYFLFDTKTFQYGGSGTKFDWQILSTYYGEIPFFLSGGIGNNDVETIKQLKNPQLYGIDLNSQFEIKPGLKDIDKLQSFISNFI